MDLWYLPKISLYIKMIIKPFIYKLPPEECTTVLDDFDDEKIKEFFLTKVFFLLNILN
jgi:hypothetical protein